MQQTSRLSIVVDTSNAKQKLTEFTAQLSAASTAATNLATQLRTPMNNVGANAARTSLAGLTAEQAKAQLQQDKLAISATKVASEQQKLTQQVLKTATAQNKLALSAQAVVIGNERAAAAARKAASGITALSSATNTLNRNWANINLSARTFTPATASARALSVQINSVTAAAARVAPAANSAAAGLNNLNAAARSADTASRGLHGTMNKLYTVMNSGLVAVTGLGFIKTAAEMQNLNNQIRLVTKSEEEAIGTKKELMRIANENYSDIGSTINLYQKSARALGNLGKSQADTLKFTNAISLAMRTGGRSAGENAAAILQLGQAMGAGVIMGDEFRSISENAPILLSLVAKEMGVLQGDLKKMSQDGLITAEVMYNAVVENEAMLTDIANGMAITMGQSWMVAKNKFKEFTDDFMNETGGISDYISQAVLTIGNNFGSMATIIGGVAVVALGSYVATSLTALAVSNGLTVSALGTSGAFSLYAGTVGIAAGAISGFIRVSTIASTVAGRVMSLGALTASGAFGALTGTISAATAAAGRWSTYSGVASAATGVLTGALSVATGAFVRLATVINAHPLMALAGVLIAVVASTKDVNGEMLGLSGAMSSLGDTIGVVGGILGNFIGMGVEGFSSLVNSAMNMINNLITGSEDGTNKSKESFGSLFGVTETGFLGIAQGAASAFDMASLTILAFVNKAINHLSNLITRAKNGVGSLKAYFGFGDGAQEKLKETGFGVLIGRQAETLNLANGGGLRGAFDGQVAKQNKEKARKAALFVPTQGEMVKGSGLQQQLKAQQQVAAAEAKELERQNKAAAKEDKSSGNNYVSNTNLKDLPLKGGIGGQATAGGKIKGYTAEFAQAAYAGISSDIKYFSGFNDKFHAGTSSKHATGSAFDIVLKDPKRAKAAASSLREYADQYGYSIKVIDEYANPSKNATGGHLHVSVLGRKKGSDGADIDYLKQVNSAKATEAASQAQEAERVMKEQLATQNSLLQEYGTAREKIATKLKDKLLEIDGSGLDKATKENNSKQAVRDAEIELSVYEKTLDKKVDALDAWQKTERDLLKDARDNAKFDAINDPELRKAENSKYLQYSLDSADREFSHKTKLLNLSQEQETMGLFEYASTDRRMFEEGWRLKIAEAQLKTDELKDIRITAYKAEYAKDQELFNLNEQKKLLALREGSMSAGDYLLANQELNIQGINNSKMPDEEKRREINAARQPLNDALQSVVSSINPESESDRIRQEYEHNLGVLDAYEKQYTHLIGVNSADRLAIEKAYQEAKAELVVNNGESIAGSLASIAKDTMGEQSSIFRAMFAMEKGFAIARSIMNIQVALSSAAASLPFPANLGAIATVAAEGASIVSTITSIAGQGFEKGGYTGSMGTKDIAGVVHGQEYVFDAKATKRIGVNNLKAMSNGQSIGGGDVNINVTVDGNGNSQVSGNNDKMGREMANGIKAVVMDIMRKEKRQGGMLYA